MKNEKLKGSLGLSFLMVFVPSVLMAQSAPPPASAPEEKKPATATESEPAAEPAPAAPAKTVSDPGLTEKFGAPEPSDSQPGVTEKDVRGGETMPSGEEPIYLNATDVDVKDLIKQISKATGTNFLIDDKVRGKVTIISEKPMTKDMAYQAFLSALDVMGYTTVQTPGGLVKLVATKEAVSEPVDIYKDETPKTDRFITRIIQVKNISANELSSVVKTLVSKEGNLFAYPSTNSLIVTDSGSNIDRILQIIRELDQEGPQETIEIIPIQHADASDITEKVLSLFEEDTGQKGGSKVRSRGRQGGAELEDAPSISKVISDERTNAVIVLGSKRAILKVRGLIARLDTPILGVEGSIHVYYLKHANAKEMAETLSSLVSGASPADKGKKGGEAASKPGAVELEGGVKVTADEATNSLVITASPKDFQTLIDKVVAKLDIRRPQVYLEAIAMELRSDKKRNLGLGGHFGSIFNLGGNEVAAFGALPPLMTPSTLTGIAAAAGGLAGGAFSENTISVGSGDSAVEIPAISAIIQALQSDSEVNVLSTPSILTLDNEEAQIQVGQEVPVPAGKTISQGVETFNVSREDVGIILKITPQISESDTVRLKLTQEISNVQPNPDPQLGPTLSKKSVQTVVIANDKQTIVIGGLIEDGQTVQTNKVPFLGDVPILGNLFKNRNWTKQKQDILVFITPHIIRDRADYLEIMKKKIDERNNFIEMNYGRGRRKQIRQAIRNHARDLLDYKDIAAKEGGYPLPAYSSPPQRVVDSPPSQPAPQTAPEIAPPPESDKPKKDGTFRDRRRR